MQENKQKLGLHQSIAVKGGSLSLDRIDHPSGNFPGDRPYFYLTSGPFSGRDGSSAPGESFRFDPYNSGEEYRFGALKFRLFTDPDSVNSLLVQS